MSQTDLPPANIEAEEALIGALAISPDRCIDVPTRLRGKMFYTPVLGVLFDTILTLWSSQHTVTDITIEDHLRKTGQDALVTASGIDLKNLPELCRNERGVPDYARLVLGSYLKRQIIDIAAEAAEDADSPSTDPEAIEGRMYQRLSELSSDSTEQAQPASIVAKDAWHSLQERVNFPEKFQYPMSPWKGYNEHYNGLAPGQLQLVAARPAMGKSALADQWAVWLAEQGVPTAFFSLEMTAEECVYREVSRLSGIDARQIMRAELDDAQMARIDTAVKHLQSLPLYYDDAGSLSIQEAMRKIRLLVIKHHIKVVFVDYVQLMSDEDVEQGRQKTREQEIATISRGLKKIAKDLKIAIVAIAQLNRALESRQDKRPQMSDLRESGQLEQDAHVITFLYREEYYTGDFPGLAELIIGKNRHGTTGTTKLGVALATMHFFDPIPLDDLVELAVLDEETWDQPIIPERDFNGAKLEEI